MFFLFKKIFCLVLVFCLLIFSAVPASAVVLVDDALYAAWAASLSGFGISLVDGTESDLLSDEELYQTSCDNFVSHYETEALILRRLADMYQDGAVTVGVAMKDNLLSLCDGIYDYFSNDSGTISIPSAVSGLVNLSDLSDSEKISITSPFVYCRQSDGSFAIQQLTLQECGLSSNGRMTFGIYLDSTLRGSITEGPVGCTGLDYWFSNGYSLTLGRIGSSNTFRYGLFKSSSSSWRITTDVIVSDADVLGDDCLIDYDVNIPCEDSKKWFADNLTDFQDVVISSDGFSVQDADISSDPVSYDDTLSGLGAIGGLLGSFKTLLEKLIHFVEGIPSAILDGLFSAVVPYDGYFIDFFNGIYQQFNDKLSLGSQLDLLDIIQNFSSSNVEDIKCILYGHEYTIISFRHLREYKETINDWIRGVIFALLVIYDINFVYKLIRNSDLVPHAERPNDKKVGGSH